MKIYYTQPTLNVRTKQSGILNANFKSRAKTSNFKKSVDSWIESNTNFYFQIVGVFILTIGMILSLQNFLDGTKLNASAKENSDLRILTNFQQSSKATASTNILQEIPTTNPTQVATTVPSTATQETNYIEYTFKTGDTLSSVALKFKVTVNDISKLNIIDSNTVITVGTKLKIPFSS